MKVTLGNGPDVTSLDGPAKAGTINSECSPTFALNNMPRDLQSHRFVTRASGLLRSWIRESLRRSFASRQFRVVQFVLSFFACVCATSSADPRSTPVHFKVHVIESKIRSGYALLVSDLNRDGRPDVVGLSTRMTELAWYENPNWERHVLVRDMNGLVNMAAHDLDGDGFPELALENEFSMVAAKSQGLVWLLKHQADPRELWKPSRVDALITSHHVAWADVKRLRSPGCKNGNFMLPDWNWLSHHFGSKVTSHRSGTT
jgi:hypothetical protein